jgi:hypothetical protein
MKTLILGLGLILSISAFAEQAIVTDSSNDETCQYNGESLPVNTRVGNYACTTSGKWDEFSCTFNGTERAEGSVVGPFTCEEGEWKNGLN